MEEQRAHGKGPKHTSFIGLATLSDFHMPLAFTHLGLTLLLILKGRRPKSRKTTTNWVGSLLLVYSVNLLQY